MASSTPASPPDPWNPVFLITLPFLLLSLGFAILRWRHWVQLIMEPEPETPSSRTKVVWALRPSNLLLCFGIVLLLYIELGHPQSGVFTSLNIPALMIISSFVLRYWENQAAKNVDLSPSDLPPDPDPPRPPSQDE